MSAPNDIVWDEDFHPFVSLIERELNNTKRILMNRFADIRIGKITDDAGVPPPPAPLYSHNQQQQQQQQQQYQQQQQQYQQQQQQQQQKYEYIPAMYQKTSQSLDTILEKITQDFWATIYQLKVSFVWAHIKRIVEEEQKDYDVTHHQESDGTYFVDTPKTDDYKLRCMSDVVITDKHGRQVSPVSLRREKRSDKINVKATEKRKHSVNEETDFTKNETNRENSPSSVPTSAATTTTTAGTTTTTTDGVVQPKSDRSDKPTRTKPTKNKTPSAVRSRSQSPRKRPTKPTQPSFNTWDAGDKHDPDADVTPTEKKIIHEIIEDISLKKMKNVEKPPIRCGVKQPVNTMVTLANAKEMKDVVTLANAKEMKVEKSGPTEIDYVVVHEESKINDDKCSNIEKVDIQESEKIEDYKTRESVKIKERVGGDDNKSVDEIYTNDAPLDNSNEKGDNDKLGSDTHAQDDDRLPEIERNEKSTSIGSNDNAPGRNGDLAKYDENQEKPQENGSHYLNQMELTGYESSENNEEQLNDEEMIKGEINIEHDDDKTVEPTSLCNHTLMKKLNEVGVEDGLVCATSPTSGECGGGAPTHKTMDDHSNTNNKEDIGEEDIGEEDTAVVNDTPVDDSDVDSGEDDEVRIIDELANDVADELLQDVVGNGVEEAALEVMEEFLQQINEDGLGKEEHENVALEVIPENEVRVADQAIIASDTTEPQQEPKSDINGNRTGNNVERGSSKRIEEEKNSGELSDSDTEKVVWVNEVSENEYSDSEPKTVIEETEVNLQAEDSCPVESHEDNCKQYEKNEENNSKLEEIEKLKSASENISHVWDVSVMLEEEKCSDIDFIEGISIANQQSGQQKSVDETTVVTEEIMDEQEEVKHDEVNIIPDKIFDALIKPDETSAEATDPSDEAEDVEQEHEVSVTVEGNKPVVEVTEAGVVEEPICQTVETNEEIKSHDDTEAVEDGETPMQSTIIDLVIVEGLTLVPPPEELEDDMEEEIESKTVDVELEALETHDSIDTEEAASYVKEESHFTECESLHNEDDTTSDHTNEPSEMVHVDVHVEPIFQDDNSDEQSKECIYNHNEVCEESEADTENNADIGKEPSDFSNRGYVNNEDMRASTGNLDGEVGKSGAYVNEAAIHVALTHETNVESGVGERRGSIEASDRADLMVEVNQSDISDERIVQDEEDAAIKEGDAGVETLNDSVIMAVEKTHEDIVAQEENTSSVSESKESDEQIPTMDVRQHEEIVLLESIEECTEDEEEMDEEEDMLLQITQHFIPVESMERVEVMKEEQEEILEVIDDGEVQNDAVVMDNEEVIDEEPELVEEDDFAKYLFAASLESPVEVESPVETESEEDEILQAVSPSPNDEQLWGMNKTEGREQNEQEIRSEWEMENGSEKMHATDTCGKSDLMREDLEGVILQFIETNQTKNDITNSIEKVAENTTEHLPIVILDVDHKKYQKQEGLDVSCDKDKEVITDGEENEGKFEGEESNEITFRENEKEIETINEIGTTETGNKDETTKSEDNPMQKDQLRYEDITVVEEKVTTDTPAECDRNQFQSQPPTEANERQIIDTAIQQMKPKIKRRTQRPITNDVRAELKKKSKLVMDKLKEEESKRNGCRILDEDTFQKQSTLMEEEEEEVYGDEVFEGTGEYTACFDKSENDDIVRVLDDNEYTEAFNRRINGGGYSKKEADKLDVINHIIGMKMELIKEAGRVVESLESKKKTQKQQQQKVQQPWVDYQQPEQRPGHEQQEHEQLQGNTSFVNLNGNSKVRLHKEMATCFFIEDDASEEQRRKGNKITRIETLDQKESEKENKNEGYSDEQVLIAENETNEKNSKKSEEFAEHILTEEPSCRDDVGEAVGVSEVKFNSVLSDSIQSATQGDENATEETCGDETKNNLESINEIQNHVKENDKSEAEVEEEKDEENESPDDQDTETRSVTTGACLKDLIKPSESEKSEVKRDQDVSLKGWHVNIFKRGSAKITNCAVTGPVQCHNGDELQQHTAQDTKTRLERHDGTPGDHEEADAEMIHHAHIEEEIELNSGLELQLVSYTNTFAGQNNEVCLQQTTPTNHQYYLPITLATPPNKTPAVGKKSKMVAVPSALRERLGRKVGGKVAECKREGVKKKLKKAMATTNMKTNNDELLLCGATKELKTRRSRKSFEMKRQQPGNNNSNVRKLPRQQLKLVSKSDGKGSGSDSDRRKRESGRKASSGKASDTLLEGAKKKLKKTQQRMVRNFIPSMDTRQRLGVLQREDEDALLKDTLGARMLKKKNSQECIGGNRVANVRSISCSALNRGTHAHMKDKERSISCSAVNRHKNDKTSSTSGSDVSKPVQPKKDKETDAEERIRKRSKSSEMSFIDRFTKSLPTRSARERSEGARVRSKSSESNFISRMSKSLPLRRENADCVEAVENGEKQRVARKRSKSSEVNFIERNMKAIANIKLEKELLRRKEEAKEKEKAAEAEKKSKSRTPQPKRKNGDGNSKKFASSKLTSRVISTTSTEDSTEDEEIRRPQSKLNARLTKPSLVVPELDETREEETDESTHEHIQSSENEKDANPMSNLSIDDMEKEEVSETSEEIIKIEINKKDETNDDIRPETPEETLPQEISARKKMKTKPAVPKPMRKMKQKESCAIDFVSQNIKQFSGRGERGIANSGVGGEEQKLKKPIKPKPVGSVPRLLKKVSPGMRDRGRQTADDIPEPGPLPPQEPQPVPHPMEPLQPLKEHPMKKATRKTVAKTKHLREKFREIDKIVMEELLRMVTGAAAVAAVSDAEKLDVTSRLKNVLNYVRGGDKMRRKMSKSTGNEVAKERRSLRKTGSNGEGHGLEGGGVRRSSMKVKRQSHTIVLQKQDIRKTSTNSTRNVVRTTPTKTKTSTTASVGSKINIEEVQRKEKRKETRSPKGSVGRSVETRPGLGEREEKINRRKIKKSSPKQSPKRKVMEDNVVGGSVGKKALTMEDLEEARRSRASSRSSIYENHEQEDEKEDDGMKKEEAEEELSTEDDGCEEKCDRSENVGENVSAKGALVIDESDSSNCEFFSAEEVTPVSSLRKSESEIEVISESDQTCDKHNDSCKFGESEFEEQATESTNEISTQDDEVLKEGEETVQPKEQLPSNKSVNDWTPVSTEPHDSQTNDRDTLARTPSLGSDTDTSELKSLHASDMEVPDMKDSGVEVPIMKCTSEMEIGDLKSTVESELEDSSLRLEDLEASTDEVKRIGEVLMMDEDSEVEREMEELKLFETNELMLSLNDGAHCDAEEESTGESKNEEEREETVETSEEHNGIMELEGEDDTTVETDKEGTEMEVSELDHDDAISENEEDKSECIEDLKCDKEEPLQGKEKEQEQEQESEVVEGQTLTHPRPKSSSPSERKGPPASRKHSETTDEDEEDSGYETKTGLVQSPVHKRTESKTQTQTIIETSETEETSSDAEEPHQIDVKEHCKSKEPIRQIQNMDSDVGGSCNVIVLKTEGDSSCTAVISKARTQHSDNIMVADAARRSHSVTSNVKNNSLNSLSDSINDITNDNLSKSAPNTTNNNTDITNNASNVCQNTSRANSTNDITIKPTSNVTSSTQIPKNNVTTTAKTKILATSKGRRRGGLEGDRDDINKHVSDISDIERVDVKMKTRNGVFEIESVDFKMKAKKHLLQIENDDEGDADEDDEGKDNGDGESYQNDSLLAMFEAVANQDISHMTARRGAPVSGDSVPGASGSRHARSCLKIRQTCQVDA